MTYNLDRILENASKALESINGEQPAMEVTGYALASLASSMFALAVMAAEADSEEARGKHGN